MMMHILTKTKKVTCHADCKKQLFIIFFNLLALIWLILTYEGLYLQCHETECYQSYEPPLWEGSNFKVNAGKFVA